MFICALALLRLETALHSISTTDFIASFPLILLFLLTTSHILAPFSDCPPSQTPKENYREVREILIFLVHIPLKEETCRKRENMIYL